MEQVEKQLHKLIDVLKIINLTNVQRVERELCLIQVNGEKRSDILQIVDIFRAKIVDVSPKEVMVEVTGDSGEDRCHNSDACRLWHLGDSSYR